jgi:galactose mutarotase-like enzyme
MVEIRGGGQVAEIVPLGAELVRWQAAGRELLWTGDPAWWSERSPLCFPVVGWTRDGQSRVAGQSYPLALHGFARHRDFALVEAAPERAAFRLEDDARTLALYPFAFRLTVTYALAKDGLRMTAEVENPGPAPMPYAFGFHPGFRWPFAAAGQGGHRIVFERAENPEVPVIAPGGLIGAGRRGVPLEGRVLPLDPALFAGDALCFLNARSRALRFEDGEGRGIAMRVENLPHLALWMRPGAPYLCLEPWSGYGDPEGFAGDLFDKPGMTVLQPGQSGRHSALFTYGGAAANA